MAHELLVIGMEGPLLRQVAPVLRRVGCNVHRIARADQAVAFLLGTPFDLLLMHYPLDGIGAEEFLSSVRSEGSPCRDSGLVMLAAADAVDQAGHLLRLGVNRVVTEDMPCERLVDAVADLLAVAPRRSLRAVVQLELWLREEGRRVISVTENISVTGMLVLGGTEFPVGSLLGFQLSLPHRPPVAGSLVVTRHTDRERERVDGFGGRIISFSGDGQDRLRELVSAG